MTKRILPALWWFLIALPAIWGAAAIWLWHKVADCSSPLSSYCLKVYEDGIVRFFSLSWVWEYQTLVAGVLAFGAGVFAFMSAKLAIKENRRLENQRQKSEAAVACTIVSSEFRDAIIEMQRLEHTSQPLHGASNPFPRSYAFLPTLCSIDPQLGPIITARLRDATKSINAPTYVNFTKQIALAEVAFYMLQEISERLSEDGKYDMDTVEKLRSKYLRSTLHHLGYSLDDIIGYRYFFDDGTK